MVKLPIFIEKPKRLYIFSRMVRRKSVYYGEIEKSSVKLRKGRKMFVDYAKIIIKSGDGGNGATSFRREKYVAAGRSRWWRWWKRW